MQAPPPNPDQPADDSLLEELAALTGLFTPEKIWQEEELLEDLDEQPSPYPAPDSATPLRD